MSIASAITNAQQKVADAYTAISNKGGTLPATQDLANMPNAINTISTGGTINSLNVTPSTSAQTITATGGVDGYSPVNVAAVTASIDSNIKPNFIRNGVTILSVTGTYGEPVPIIYEFIIDTTQSNPDLAVTYTGTNANYTPASMNFTTGVLDYGSWGNAFFQPRPVMLKYDGTVDYELDKDNFTLKADGVTPSDVDNSSYQGNCMIGFPQVWMKFAQDDSTHQHVYIANQQIDSDYHCYTHYNKSGDLLDEIYIMAYGVSVTGSPPYYRSLAGLTVDQSGNADTRIYAQNVGTGWDFMDYGELQMLQMLFILMFKSLNSNGKCGTGDISEAGGELGYSVTGGTKNKGMFYANNNYAQLKFFGIENLWGYSICYINGLLVINDGANSTIKYKLCDYTTDGSTVADYSWSGTGYKTLGQYTNSSITNGSLQKLYLTSDGMFITPDNISGTDYTTYYCAGEYFYGSNYRNTASFGLNIRKSNTGLFSMYGRLVEGIWLSPTRGTLTCKPILNNN